MPRRRRRSLPRRARSSSTARILLEIAREYAKSSHRAQWTEERPEIKRALSDLRRRFQGIYEIEECIAVAGSRAVFRISQTATHEPFVLKVCRPLKNAIELVTREAKNVVALSHPNLIRILDSGESPSPTTHPKQSLPFSIEEYIPEGLTIEKWLTRELGAVADEEDLSTVLEKLQSVVLQILTGIHYLHQHDVYHCDIKPENILIKQGTVKIVDFGYSVRRFPLRPLSTGGREPRIGFTWNFAYPPLRKDVESMESPAAAFVVDEHRVSLARIDQYAVGRTIEELVKSVASRRRELEQSSLEEGRERRSPYATEAEYVERYLLLVAGRLKGVESFDDFEPFKGIIVDYPKEVVKSISYGKELGAFEDAATDLKRIGSDNLSAFAIEWDPGLSDRVRVGYIDVPFTPRIRLLMNHPAVSRLARVTQLGLAAFVYPAARHSRLEHSLGTYAWACRYIQSLWGQVGDPFFRCVAHPDELMAASLAALLHDLGQYPHCHDIEDAFPSVTNHQRLADGIYTREWPTGAGGTTPSLRAIVAENWGEAVATQVSHYLTRPRYASSSTQPVSSVLHALISGPIDVDKLDFVQRDSTNLGIAYGGSIESDRLTSSLRCIIRPMTAHQMPNVTLGVSQKGVLAANTLVVAREQMFERVYWHKTVRAFKSMLATALRRGVTKPAELEAVVRGAIEEDKPLAVSGPTGLPPESFHLSESHVAMLVRLREVVARDPPAVYLIDQVLQRRPYKHLMDVGTTEWWGRLDRGKVEAAFGPLRHILEIAPSRTDLIEASREALQQLLFERRLLLRNSLDGRRAENLQAKKVAILLDIPRERVAQSTLLVEASSGGSEREVDLGLLPEGVGHDWLKSTVPRVYINPLYAAPQLTRHMLIELLAEANRSLGRLGLAES